MSEKTKEITLLNVKLSLFEFYDKNKEGKGSGYPGRLIKDFCNQEKRSAAIAFWNWAMGTYVAHSHMGVWDGKKMNENGCAEWISPKDAYDLYLQSLPKTV